jgi:hypothetical protein
MDRESTIKALVGLRMAVGIGSWVAPRFSGSLFGIDAGANEQAPYVARLFGARDAGLAYGALTASGEAQNHWLAVGLACDLADAAAGFAAGRGGYLGRASSVMVTVTALAAAGMGVAALQAPAAD